MRDLISLCSVLYFCLSQVLTENTVNHFDFKLPKIHRYFSQVMSEFSGWHIMDLITGAALLVKTCYANALKENLIN